MTVGRAGSGRGRAEGLLLPRRSVLKLSALPLAAGLVPGGLMADGRPDWHMEDGGFRNNYSGPVEKKLSDLRKAFEPEKPPIVTFPLAENDPAALKANRSETTVTWIGHCTLLLQAGGINVLTDPHFTERASPVPFAGPKRTMPVGLEVADLPPIDLVLISHNHYDHLDYSSVRMVAAHSPDAVFHVPLKLGPWFRGAGIEKVVEMDWWQEGEAGDARVTSVPTQHWSNRVMFDRNKTLWCGWVLETAGFSFVFIGDTGYSKDFEDIGARFGGFDLAAIPIGAYEPRWFMHDVHQNPEEAVRCMADLKARKAVATHWGTFQLTLEPMDEPVKRLRQAMAKSPMGEDDFMALAHGETRYL